MKLLVRNLATATSSDKIKTLFSEYGIVQSCNLVLDQKTGKSKGFGFVEMPKAGEAKVAMQKLNGYKLAGSIIRIKKAKINKESTKIVATPAPKEKTEKVNLQVDPDKMQDNENNTLKIYGKIKEQEDF